MRLVYPEHKVHVEPLRLRKRKRVSLNLDELIPQAWDLLWKDNLKQRKKMKPDAYRYGSTFYLTASDVEYQVRQFVVEELTGEPRGSRGRCWGRPWEPVRISGPNLNGRVRDWLLHNHELTSHNFGRGHISGMRFRPKGEPLAPSEMTTMKEKERRKNTPRPVHMELKTGPYSRRCLCQEGRKRNPFARHRGFGPRMTTKVEEVTCVQCKNKIKAKGETAE